MESVKVDRRRRVTRAIVLALVVLPFVILGWSLIEARWLRVDGSVVVDPDIPAEFNGTRIAFVSDIHAGSLLGEGYLRRTVDLVSGLDADLIVLGGDYMSGGSNEDMFFPQARRLKAPLGVIAVMGNHDTGARAEKVRSGLAAADITLLEDANVRIARGGASMRIAGLEDLSSQQPDIELAAADIPTNEFSVLVSHNPDALVTDLPRVRGAFDLALAGHTHGGQITLFALYAPYVPSAYGQRFLGGWSEVEGVPTLVTRGSGVLAVPMRFFAPPQVHLIELRSGKAQVVP